MSRLANILVAGEDSPYRDGLVEHLTSHDYSTCVLGAAAGLGDTVREARPDVVIIDASSSAFDGFRTASGLSGGDAIVPVVLARADRSPEVFRRALEAGADDVLMADEGLSALWFRLQPLLRLSTMRAELARRVALAREFGHEPEALEPADAEARPALVVAGADADRQALLGATFGGGCTIEPADGVSQAEQLLDERAFDACVVFLGDGEASEPVLELCEHVRNNPRLFNLPMVVAAARDSFADMARAYGRGVSRLVLAPFEEAEFHFVLKTLVDRQRRCWSIRAKLEGTKGPATLDPATETYSREFLNGDIERVTTDAHTWRKNVTAVFLSVPEAQDVRVHFGDSAADDLVRQIGQWITGLIRVEDLIARYSAHDFCVLLPDTPLREARAVMQRIAGIISHTDFAVAEVYQPISVPVEVGIAELETGENADGLLARARANLD